MKNPFLVVAAILFVQLVFGTAFGQTVTKNAGQLSTVSGRWAVNPADGGCTLQADCSFVNPDVVCSSAPQNARPAICAMMAQSFGRAATISNAVSDGGAP